MLYNYQSKKTLKLELTPLLDIIFILLIFFAVSTSIITNQQGIKLDIPKAETSTKEEIGLVVSIKPNQTIIINQKNISIKKLSQLIENYLNQNPNTQVILKADQTLNYGFIIKVLDKIRLGGITDITLQAKKKINK